MSGRSSASSVLSRRQRTTAGSWQSWLTSERSPQNLLGRRPALTTARPRPRCRNELCFLERLDQFTPVSDVDDAVLRTFLERGATLLQVNSRGGARVTRRAGTSWRLYVYNRTGRPCRRRGTLIKSRTSP